MTLREVSTALKAAFGFGDYRSMSLREKIKPDTKGEAERMMRAARALKSEAEAFNKKPSAAPLDETLKKLVQDL